MLTLLLSSLETTIANATQMASVLPQLTESEQLLVYQFITRVVEEVGDTWLGFSDKDKISYLRLYLKVREPEQDTRTLTDFLTDEQITAIRQYRLGK